MISDYDRSSRVIVIGAGASGLAATRDLVQAGFKVTVLEARSRIGGRVFTVHRSKGSNVELGAEFAHGKPADFKKILRGTDTIVRPIDDTHAILWGGILLRKQDVFGPVGERMKEMRAPENDDRPVADFLEEQRSQLDPMTFAMLFDFIEGFNAADARDLSLKAFAKENSDAGDLLEMGRILPGYDGVFEALAKDVDPDRYEIALDTRVRKIDWRAHDVEVTSDTPDGPRTDVGSAVIVTVPPTLLTGSDAIQFSPALPDKRVAASQITMGLVSKVVFVFRERLWSSEKDIHFMHAPQLIFGVHWSWDWTKPFIVTSWAGGSRGNIMRGWPRDAIIDQALKDLAIACGTSTRDLAQNLIETYFHDWNSDPLSLGAYSGVSVGGSGSREKLAEEVEGTLFFAGEATNFEGLAGTVNGAIATGRRAAKEVIRSRSWLRRFLGPYRGVKTVTRVWMNS